MFGDNVLGCINKLRWKHSYLGSKKNFFFLANFDFCPFRRHPGCSLEGLMLKLKLQATWCEELSHLKRPWCWERLREGGEGDDRGWDGWMASLTQWIWVWIDSGSWWWTGRPGLLQFMGLQRVGHDWATELNWNSVVMKKGSYMQDANYILQDVNLEN